jgi:hypothetical protein
MLHCVGTPDRCVSQNFDPNRRSALTSPRAAQCAEYVEKYAKPEELAKAKEAGSDSDSEWSEGGSDMSEEENEASNADL